ncbi:glycosyltransferase family 2 protein [Patescibacteria group bacterium]|nr:glycosyltransferase family 2 protein [Patescibacteria group bacterium]MBU2579448.1 glycosyltransferase family 2 protein [Patescibacteria group bacterium]MBU4031160.1 glycosyltransferase family 2 protein [Patescibacteria group bacterium]
MKKISVVIPVYNEATTVEKVIQDLRLVLSATAVDYEIIAVDDASKDQSGDILEQIKDITVIRHSENQGYGASIKTGAKSATGEYILIIDGDATYPTEAIPRMIEHIDHYDLVSGERRGKNFDARWLYLQRVGKFVLRMIASYITQHKIPDINCGLRIYRKETFDKFLYLYPNQFSLTTTSLVAFLSNNYRVKFIPIDYHKRTGKSTLKPLKSFGQFIGLLLKISLFFKPIRIFLPLSMLLLLSAISIAFYSLYFQDIFYDTTTILLATTALQTFFFGLLAEIIVHNRR